MITDYIHRGEGVCRDPQKLIRNIWMTPKGISEICFLLLPFSEYIIFFRQNIWHSIFDQFHFHHIFGDEMSVIRQDRQQTKALVVSHTLKNKTVKSSRNILGTSWMAMRGRSFKYLDAQQVSQQISIFFKSKFHNEWGVCEKSYFDVFFWQWSHLSFPKISTLTDPPVTCFAYIPKIFDKYQMPIFFIEYLGSLRPVRTWLMYIWSKLSKN